MAKEQMATRKRTKDDVTVSLNLKEHRKCKESSKHDRRLWLRREGDQGSPLSDASPGSEAVILSIPLVELLNQTRRQPQKGLGVDPIQ